MSIPDHPIWQELESYFRTRISENERIIIIEIIRKALAENPGIELDQLTLMATEVVLRKRPQERAHR